MVTSKERKAVVCKVIQRVFLAVFPLFSIAYIFDIFSYFDIPLFREQYLAACLVLALPAAFLSLPISKNISAFSWPNIIMAILSSVIAGYIVFFYPQVSMTIGQITPIRVIFGGICIVLILEATRRSLGWALVGVVLFFILYSRYAAIFPGVLRSAGVPWERLFLFLYLDPSSLIGLPVETVFGIIAAYILFGQFLFGFGAGQFLVDIASAFLGRFKGGPALIAVGASGLYGMLSGSAVSDVVTTGSVTIPMMKKFGYSPNFACGVEAAASSGGPIMPPVMGTVAFLMAEFLRIQYAEVALRSFIPAVLYYFTIMVGVRLTADELGVKALTKDEVVKVKPILRRGWPYFIPIFVLFYTLFGLNLQAGKAGVISAASVIVVGSYLKRDLGLRGLINILIGAGNMLTQIVVICCAAGFIIGTMAISGLGFSFAEMLIKLSGGNIFALLIMVAIANIIMGMGLPMTAIYILLSVLIVPAIVESGYSPFASHLFIIYFAVVSFLTPPVCLAIYSSCAIGGGEIWRSAGHGIRLSVAAYILPFVFLFDPTILLFNSWGNILQQTVLLFIGLAILETALIGWLVIKISLIERLLLFVASGVVIISWLPILLRITIGLAIIFLFSLWFFRYRIPRSKAVSA